MFFVYLGRVFAYIDVDKDGYMLDIQGGDHPSQWLWQVLPPVEIDRIKREYAAEMERHEPSR